MVRAITKVAFSLFKKHFIRFLTIMAIVVVSIGFMSGIGEVESKVKDAAKEVYTTRNVSDLYLKSKRETGFTLEELDWLSRRFGEENLLHAFSYETKLDDAVTRVHAFDLEKNEINITELQSGRLPSKSNEIIAERKTQKLTEYAVGDTVSIQGVEYTVTGILFNPYYFSEVEEPSFQYEEQDLANVFYINTQALPMCNDLYITLEDRSLFNDTFSNGYEATIENLKSEIATELGAENVETLSLFENYGFFSLVEYADKVGVISIIFVIFFLLVTLLVVYSTMSRLLTEERAQIACQKTLGYTDFQILRKYALFVFVATMVGSLLAFPVGLGLTAIVYNAFNMQYAMVAFPKTLACAYYLITVAIVVVSTLLLTCWTGHKLIKEKPALLLTPKMPKSGKKVFLERVGFIWRRLSFKYKSTVRNIFLFKSRFFMTVFSIMGSCVLVFCGLGLLNCAAGSDSGDMLEIISIALLTFSAVLSALVIYNLTNINVSERNREIATLMVLGYHKKEVTGYIFREIYVMSIIGAVLGVPLGILFIDFVFGLIDFGTLNDIAWWTYILTPCVTVFFSFISTLLLKRRIANTDMNASLKSVE